MLEESSGAGRSSWRVISITVFLLSLALTAVAGVTGVWVLTAVPIGLLFGVFLEKEIERVDNRHFGHQVDGHRQLARLVGKHDPGLVIAERILLPVDKVLLRCDLQRITKYPGPAMGGGAQANDVRRQVHGPVEMVFRSMVDGDLDRHGLPDLPSVE